MANLENMSREDFIELFGMDVDNLDDMDTMECIYDVQHDEDGMSWFEIAKCLIRDLNMMLLER